MKYIDLNLPSKTLWSNETLIDRYIYRNLFNNLNLGLLPTARQFIELDFCCNKKVGEQTITYFYNNEELVFYLNELYFITDNYDKRFQLCFAIHCTTDGFRFSTCFTYDMLRLKLIKYEK